MSYLRTGSDIRWRFWLEDGPSVKASVINFSLETDGTVIDIPYTRLTMGTRIPGAKEVIAGAAMEGSGRIGFHQFLMECSGGRDKFGVD